MTLGVQVPTPPTILLALDDAMTLAKRRLGQTRMTVSALGLGAGPLGDPKLSDNDATRLLHEAVAGGINVLDTAPSYGASESRIGRFLGAITPSQRDALVIATKGGYGVEGTPDWTPDVITRGIDQALRRLDTDHVDVFLLHSCPLERLTRGDLLEPLMLAKRAGKARAVGYSGDGAALTWALDCAAFDVVECSVNLLDQRALGAIETTTKGVLAKRSLASAPWSPDASQKSEPVYVERWRDFVSPPRDPPGKGPGDDPGDVLEGLPWDEIALRFAAFAPGVTSALFGTRQNDNLARGIEFVSRGPLAKGIVAAIRARFRHDWHGVI